jgi:hypothetical protein
VRGEQTLDVLFYALAHDGILTIARSLEHPLRRVACGVPAADCGDVQHTMEVAMNVSSVTARLTPQMVTQAAVQAAGGDGDGLTGAAALNDGDAAAHAAATQRVVPATPAPAAAAAAAPAVTARGSVDVKVV